MGSGFALIGLAMVLFASTNVDDLFVLTGFFADRTLRAREIVLGQYAGITVLTAVSVAASLLSLVIPRAYVGLMGVIPIVIGVGKLLEVVRERGLGKEADRQPNAKGIATVALVTIANGGDNIGIYTPAFALRSGREVVAIACVFAVMTAVWCFAAHGLVNLPRVGAPIRRYAHVVTPVVLIGLGVMVLAEAGSFGLVGR